MQNYNDDKDNYYFPHFLITLYALIHLIFLISSNETWVILPLFYRWEYSISENLLSKNYKAGSVRKNKIQI